MSELDPPDNVRAAAAHWRVELTERTHTRYSQTWFGLRDGEHVVLKVGSVAGRRREAAALAAYAASDEPVACRLLAQAPGALLLERVLLGDDLRPLAAVDDDAATSLAGQLYARLHQVVAACERPVELLRIAALAEAFEDYDQREDVRLGGEPPLPADLTDRARAMLAELAVASESDIVLHGDAHHQNLIRDGRGDSHDTWRVIDPQGWWGDPTFDAVALMLNLHGSLEMSRTPQDQLRGQARRRADILAETAGLDQGRLLAWTFVGAVLAEVRCLADHGFVQGGPLRLAQALRAVG